MSRRKVGRTLVGKRVVDGQEFVVWRLAPDDIAVAVGQRTHPRQNSFDQTYLKGRFPAWFRNVGMHLDPESGDTRQGFYKDEEAGERRPRPAEEEPYIQALVEFFDDRLAWWPGTPTQKEWIRKLMDDTRSQRDIAEEDGLTQAAVSLGRRRAVEAFVKYMGGKGALAERLRAFLDAKEQADGLPRVKFLPRYVHE